LLIKEHVDVAYGEVQPLQGLHHKIGARKRKKKNEAWLSEKKLKSLTDKKEKY